MMDNPSLHELMVRSNLSKNTIEIIHHIFQKDKIPQYKAIRLMLLLKKLGTDHFRVLSPVEKKKLLGNLFHFFAYRKMENISHIFYLFFEGRLRSEKSEFLLPQKMIKALINVGKGERREDVKELVWGLLLMKEVGLHEYISPEELLFGIWSGNPLFRNNVIRFLFTHFHLHTIINGVIRYMSETDRSLAPHAFTQLVGIGGKEEDLKQKLRLLTAVLNYSQLANTEIDQIYSDFLKTLSRFELIKTLSSNNRDLTWIEDLRQKKAQMSFGFKSHRDMPVSYGSFQDRVAAIDLRGELIGGKLGVIQLAQPAADDSRDVLQIHLNGFGR